MDWSILAGKMAEIGLPALGGLFGGPLGSTLGGIVGSAVAKTLGVPETPEAVREAVDANPSAASIALAKIEAEAKRTEAEFADLANARGQTIALAQAGSSIAWGAPVISLVTTIGFFTVLGLLFFAGAEMSDRTFSLINILLGVLAAQFAQVGSYWLGSSEGSKRNGDALRAVAAQTVTPSPNQVARDAISVAKGRR